MGESLTVGQHGARWPQWLMVAPVRRCLLFLLLAAVLHATGAPAADALRLRTLSIAQGLSQVSAAAVLQDRNGFIWIATQDGLNRFDGYEFRVFRHIVGDSSSISDNYVISLAEDSAGGIWVGTQNGLNRFDPQLMRFERFAAGSSAGALRDNVVLALHAGTQAAVFVSTRRGGIARFDALSRRFETPPGLPSFTDRQKLLHVHDDGRLIFASDGELWALDPGKAAQRLLTSRPTEGSILVGVPRPGGGYAIGSATAGVLLIDPQGRVQQQLRMDKTPAALPDDAVRALQFDRSGRLWIGTAQGLARLEQDGSVRIWRHETSDPNGLPGDRVAALYSDRSGLLWIGTWTAGVALFDAGSEQIRVVQRTTGLPSNAVTALSPSDGGRLWVGMIDRGGVAELAADGSVIRQFNTQSAPHPLAADDVTALLHEPRGLWVGYRRGGLDLLLGDGGIRRFPVGDDGLPASTVQALSLDGNGSLWIGLLGAGVYSLCADCSQPQAWPIANGLPRPAINAIVQTRDGLMWFAVRRGGVFWFDPRSSKSGSLTAGGALALPHESVTSVLEDAQGLLWLGSQGGGLSAITRDANGLPTQIKTYSEAQGLVSSMVSAILNGGNRELWISTSRGVCRFFVEKDEFECFDDRDPALAADFFVGAAARDNSGTLHFGSSQGLLSIPSPQDLRLERRDVPLLLTELRIDNRPVKPGVDAPITQAIEFVERLRLRHDQDLFSIEFAALDPRRASALHYRYRLQGRDAQWIATDEKRRIATYTGLPAGQYVFEVQALDRGAIVGQRSVPIDVLAAPWMGLWARLAYALLLVTLLALIGWRYRRRLVEREQSQDALAQSEALLKYALWGSRAELWDADLRLDKLLRRNRLEHMQVTRSASAASLQAYTPFVHADDRARFREALIACVKGDNDLFECSYRSPDIDGQWRWLLSRGRVFSRDAQGRALRMVGTTFDITELRTNEEALRSSEDRLNLALWGSGDEMWDVDLSSGRMRRENALSATALTAEVQFPKLIDYLQYIHPSDQTRVRDALVAHLKGEVDHYECSYRTRALQGGWLWILSKGRVLLRDPQGKAQRMVGTNRDISKLKQVEEDLRFLNEELEVRVQRRTAALEKANVHLKQTLDQLTRAQRQLVESEKLAALGGLVAGVAHEINTPLGVGVTAASHLQLESQRLVRVVREGKMTRADLEQFLDQAQQSSDLVLRNLERASQLVRSFKQVAVDQSSEQRRSFILCEYLDEILLSLHPRIKKSRVQVEIKCDAGITMDTYPGAFYQVIVNLVMNALVHAFADEDHGQINIECALDGDDVLVDFRDNGKGMSESVKNRVFEPFFTTKRGSGGSGLGLHIVYNLITLVLRGQVSCNSELDKGTHFRLLLPRVAPGAGETA